MFMDGPRTPEREQLRKMYFNLFEAQKLAAEALGLPELAREAELGLQYLAVDSTNTDMGAVVFSLSKISYGLLKNAKAGLKNEAQRKKIEEAHVYAARAGNEGQIFFTAVTAIFSSSNFEDAAAATEVASRTKGNLNFFYKALNKIRNENKVVLPPEIADDFGAAEDSIDI